MGKVVGIDLGTTNSVVAVMEGGKPVVIANAEGMRTTPSVVGFSKDGDRLVGQLARRQAVLNPANTFYWVKRFMGRKYTELNPASKRVPYTIRRDEKDNIKVKCPRLEREFAPEEISAMILRKLADEAARYMGQPITGAVITVPAYFNDAQRQATRNAGRIAGLEVKRILNEPTAAALSYGLDNQNNQTILVFDLGGGTFDVSILKVGNGVFEVKATSGDTQLGGNDFDEKIVTWLADQFLENEGIDLRRDRQALQRLTEAAEKAKIELSGVGVTEISLPFITATAEGPKHIETRLNRSQFEGFCVDLTNRLKLPVKQALSDAGLMPTQIDEVVLVGGSTRIPMVQQVVRSLIDLEPNQNVNPDEVVAVGAAIQAGILTQEIPDIMLLDVTPLSLGLETIGGVMKKLIPRNSTIPIRRSDIFSTSENNQTMVEVHTLQGEREMARDNKSLGRFKLMGIPPAPRGVPQVLVSFDIDANGILQVSALDKATGREQGITIQEASTLSENEIDQMIQEAEENADADRFQRERIEKRNRAESMTFQAERTLREVALDFGLQFARDRRRQIESLIQELRASLERNDERSIDIAQAELQDALYALRREAYLYDDGEDDDDLFGSIKRAFTGDDDEESFFGSIRRTLAGDDDWDYGTSYNRDRYNWNDDNWDDDWDDNLDYRRASGRSDWNNDWNQGAARGTARNGQSYRDGYAGSGRSDDRWGSSNSSGYGNATSGGYSSQNYSSGYSDSRYESGRNAGNYRDPYQDPYGQNYSQDYSSAAQSDAWSGNNRRNSGSGYSDNDWSTSSQGYGEQRYSDQSYQRQDYPQDSQSQRYSDPTYRSQGYSNQDYSGNYSDQRYPDQGYSDQTYQNQGYSDQRYPDRGYPNQGDQNQGYPDQRYSDQGYPRQGDQNQSYGTGRNWDGSDATYPEQRGYSEPSGTTSYRQTEQGAPQGGYRSDEGTPYRGTSDPYSDPNQSTYQSNSQRSSQGPSGGYAANRNDSWGRSSQSNQWEERQAAQSAPYTGSSPNAYPPEGGTSYGEGRSQTYDGRSSRPPAQSQDPWDNAQPSSSSTSSPPAKDKGKNEDDWTTDDLWL